MNVLRALKPLLSGLIFITYWGVVVVIQVAVELPGPDWIYWVVVWLVPAGAVLFLLILVGSRAVDFTFGRRSRKRAQEREIIRIREALKIKSAADPGISHTALVRSVQGSRSLAEDAVQRLVVSGELECVQKGRVRRYFVEPVRADIDNAELGPTV